MLYRYAAARSSCCSEFMLKSRDFIASKTGSHRFYSGNSFIVHVHVKVEKISGAKKKKRRGSVATQREAAIIIPSQRKKFEKEIVHFACRCHVAIPQNSTKYNIPLKK